MTKASAKRQLLSQVGLALAHDSAQLHVRGEAAYIDDYAEPSGTVHIAPVHSNFARGRLIRLDLEAAAKSPGVVTILTAKDIPGVNDCSPSIGGDPILADDEIMFHGQVICAVVATTRDAARRAARLAEFEIEAETPNISVDDGITAGETVLDSYAFKRGDPSDAILASTVHIGESLRIGGQEHFYLEGQIAMAIPSEAGEIKVLSSTQHPSEVQHLVARMLNLPEAKVVCECRRMGGGFGGKESQAGQWACLAALASRKTGRAAKIRLDRDDDMVATGKRHDFLVSWRVGCDKTGVIEGVEVDFSGRCGCSADLSLGVNDRTMFHADNSYYYPHVHIRSHRIKTNTVSNTAFRGFGGPQGMVFAERMMDGIAIRLSADPLDIRKRNFYRRGRDITPYGMRVKDNVLRSLIGELERSSDYRKRRKEIGRFNAENRFLKKGIALNPVKFGIAFTLKHLNQAGALVHVYTDGSIQVNHGGTEMGQGLYIKVAQVVAEVFGVDTSKVRITATTTDKVPNTTPTAASSGSDLNGMAAKRAAETIRERMVALAGKLYQCDAKSISFAKGMVRVGNREIGFADLAKQCFLERVSLSSTGYFATPKITWDRQEASGNPFLYFAYGGSCSEVTIDCLTGESKIERVDILHDCGSSLNPAIDLGQIEGGFVQGMGWLTTEELVFDHNGRLTTHAPSTYKIPTAADVPHDFRVKIWGNGRNRENTIYRSKAVGEPPVMLATSVFSAIFHAIASIRPGEVPLLNAPATPEAVLRAIAELEARPGS